MQERDGGRRKKYSQEDIADARDVSLVDAAAALGYHPRRKGRFFDLEEHDSLRVFPNNSYCRFSSILDGKPETGSTIDFVMRYGNMSFPEAVSWLLQYSGRVPGVEGDAAKEGRRVPAERKPRERKEFRLPERNENNRRMYAYLCKTRGIPFDLVQELWKKGLIYESKERHNVVFVSYDREGKARHAFQRGTAGTFKNDVEGSEKEDFCFTLPATGIYTDTVCVYEAAIDAISACALDRMDGRTGDGEPWRVAMGMLSDSPLAHFLSEHPEVRRIVFGFDLDERGRLAVYGDAANPGLLKKWTDAGYLTVDCPAELPDGKGKDFNDLLLLRVRGNDEKVEKTLKSQSGYVPEQSDKLKSQHGYLGYPAAMQRRHR